MKKTRFTEEQMVAVLREQDAGAKVEDICRKHNISNQTFYAWKKKFGGMEATEVKRMRELEDENAWLKRIVANQSLEIEAVKEVLKKSGDPAAEARSCRTAHASRIERASRMQRRTASSLCVQVSKQKI